MRVELGTKLALVHTLLAAIALVWIHHADVLGMEEIRNAPFLDIASVRFTITITVTYPHHVRCHTSPHGMHQALFVEFADELHRFIFLQHFERRRDIRIFPKHMEYIDPQSEAVALVGKTGGIVAATAGHAGDRISLSKHLLDIFDGYHLPEVLDLALSQDLLIASW